MKNQILAHSRKQGSDRTLLRTLTPAPLRPSRPCGLDSNSRFSRQSGVRSLSQVLAHEARPRIGRPRQEGRAGGIGSMAYEIMARNYSEKNLNSGRSLQL